MIKKTNKKLQKEKQKNKTKQKTGSKIERTLFIAAFLRPVKRSGTR